ncbi:MAG: hypothetical protein IPM35_17000 [Myxococcales bacterium]|nr:hypothetical protein [Myxococcales bacterium]
MAFYDQPRAWYFHDLWKRTLSTWGTGQSWTRVDLARPGPALDYPEFAAGQTQSNLTILAAHGQSGIARRFRWNGSAWVLDAQRSTGSDVGALDFASPGNASPFGGSAPKQVGESSMGLAMPLAFGLGAFALWKLLK